MQAAKLIEPTEDRLILAPRVCEISGGVTKMTLHRWLRDPRRDFPKPLRLGGRRYWREAEVRAWVEAQREA
jgi:predicted DNA-binding transcriptional regulator AlpA